MSDRDLQAPWIGLCGSEYYGYDNEREILGYCEDCGKELYESDEHYKVFEGYVCERCKAKREGDEEEEEYEEVAYERV